MKLRNLKELFENDPSLPADWDIIHFYDNYNGKEVGRFFDEHEFISVLTTFDREKNEISVEVISGYDTSPSARRYDTIIEHRYTTDDPDYYDILFTISRGLKDMRERLLKYSIGSIYNTIDRKSSLLSDLDKALEKQLKKLR